MQISFKLIKKRKIKSSIMFLVKIINKIQKAN